MPGSCVFSVNGCYIGLFMKKIVYLWGIVCLVAMLSLQSCSDDEGYSLGDFTAPQLATVRTISGTGFYLDCDVWGTCWPVNTNMGWYVPIDGQRVVVTFNPLWDDYGGFDHAVMILDMTDVLTSCVESMSPADEEGMGHEAIPTTAGDITISNGYLNVWFLRRLPFSTAVRLVYPQPDAAQTTSMGASDDGYIHLELRCNTQTDTDTPGTYSLISYSLNELQVTAETKGIKLKLNMEGAGEEELTFDLVTVSESQNNLTAHR